MKENKKYEKMKERENKTIFEDNINNETNFDNKSLSFEEDISQKYILFKEYEGYEEIIRCLDSEKNKNKEYEIHNEIIAFLKIGKKKELKEELIKIDIDYLVFEEKVLNEKENKKNNIKGELKLYSKENNIHKIKKVNHSYKEEIKNLRIDDDEILILYKVEKNENYQRIQLFGYEFVENNKDICKLIIKNKEYKLNEYINIKNIKNTKLIKIRLKGINKIEDISYMFNGCKELYGIYNNSIWNIKNIINMDKMFLYCSSLCELKININWNTNNVYNMSGLFSGCSSLKEL